MNKKKIHCIVDRIVDGLIIRIKTRVLRRGTRDYHTSIYSYSLKFKLYSVFFNCLRAFTY